MANRDDAWYATNGMLFQIEMIKKNLRITQNYDDSRVDFTIRVSNPVQGPLSSVPLPLRLVVPGQWAKGFAVEITTSPSGAFETGRLPGQVWVDLLAQEAKLELQRE